MIAHGEHGTHIHSVYSVTSRKCVYLVRALELYSVILDITIGIRYVGGTVYMRELLGHSVFL